MLVEQAENASAGAPNSVELIKGMRNQLLGARKKPRTFVKPLVRLLKNKSIPETLANGGLVVF